jgi:hypothetical protein
LVCRLRYRDLWAGPGTSLIQGWLRSVKASQHARGASDDSVGFAGRHCHACTRIITVIGSNAFGRSTVPCNTAVTSSLACSTMRPASSQGNSMTLKRLSSLLRKVGKVLFIPCGLIVSAWKIEQVLTGIDPRELGIRVNPLDLTYAISLWVLSCR